MAQVNQQTLNDIVATITHEFQPNLVILFGSQATRKSNQNSDIDLLIVDSQPFDQTRSRRKEAARIMRALGRFLLPVDILLYSQHEFDQRKTDTNSVPAHAFREGRILYERG